MAYKFINNYETKLTAQATAAATSITVANASGVTVTAGDTLRLTIQNANATQFELIDVTAVSGNVLTVLRACEGTTAQAWPIDSIVICGVTKAQLESFRDRSDLIPIANGGTNSSTASQARLALGIGTVGTFNTVPIANGGTGAITVANARTNLGLGSVATMNNIPIANGGTGANTAPNARVALGLGTAATANVTTSSKDTTKGAVMRQGDWGVARQADDLLPIETLPLSTGLFPNCSFFRTQGGDATGHGAGVGQAVGLAAGTYLMQYMTMGNTTNAHAFIYPMNVQHSVYHGTLSLNNGSTTVKRFFKFYDDANTTVDANGFIKVASPIVKLFSDHIELNEEANEQQIAFERVNVGHYLIKGSSGFATDSWWFNVPVDSNGNKIVASTHKALADGALEIKTYKRKFDIETATIVPDFDQQIDIPNSSNGEQRWIDIRLNEIPKEVD